MEKAMAVIQFISYELTRIQFEKTPAAPHLDENKAVELHPQFSRKIIEEPDHRYAIDLGVRLDQQDLPFQVELTVRGHFAFNGVSDPQKALRINATSILFPYLRASLSNITMAAGYPPVVLPTFNISELFEQNAESSN